MRCPFVFIYFGWIRSWFLSVLFHRNLEGILVFIMSLRFGKQWLRNGLEAIFDLGFDISPWLRNLCKATVGLWDQIPSYFKSINPSIPTFCSCILANLIWCFSLVQQDNSSSFLIWIFLVLISQGPSSRIGNVI